MKTTSLLFASLLLLIGIVVNMPAVRAQEFDDEVAQFRERTMDGPRLGLTFALYTDLQKKALKTNSPGKLMSQFGWHFEYRVVPQGGGPQFVVEFVPLVANVEGGTIIPSATLALGIRLIDGLEFGLGPNAVFGGDKGVNTALMMTVGKSFNYSGVNLPVNLVFVTGKDGNRISLMFGYAIGRRSK